MDLTLTPAAEKFILRLLRFDGGPTSGLRLRVTPGGCSGFNADFSVAAAPTADEKPVKIGPVTLFLAAESRVLLDRVTIDFADTPTASGFTFLDPKNTCGCAPKAPETAGVSSVLH